MERQLKTSPAWLSADPEFSVFGAGYEHTLSGYDPLFAETRNHHLCFILPTSSRYGEGNPQRESSVGDHGSEVPREITSCLWMRGDDWESTFQEWLDFYRERNITVDIDRALRYAIWSGNAPVVEHLLRETDAHVLSRDVLDRTALFYTVASHGRSEVLDLVLAAIGDATILQSELQRRDLHGYTVAYYAARSGGTASTEAILTALSDVKTRTEIAHNAFAALQTSGEPISEGAYTLMLYGKMSKWLMFPIYIEHNDGETTRHGASYRGVFALQDLHVPSSELDAFLTSQRYSHEVRNSLIWIHVPWNNGNLLNALYTVIRGQLRTRIDGAHPSDEREACRRVYTQSWASTAIAPGNPFLTYRPPTCDLFDNSDSIGLGAMDDDEEKPEKTMRSARIVFPYISLESITSFIEIRRRHIQLCQPFESEFGFTSEQIQTERTLDEAHYPSLSPRTLDEYNFDQVTTRECKKTVDGEPVEGNARPILMVAQFWVWRFGNYMLTSKGVPSTSPQDLLMEHGNPEVAELSELREDSSKDVNGERAEELQVAMGKKADEARKSWVGPDSRVRGAQVDIQIGSLLAIQIEQFGKLQANKTFQSPLDYFEIGVARVMSDVNEYTRHTDNEILDIKKEEKFLHDLSDIRGELMTVDEILADQQELLEEFIAGAEPMATRHRYWTRLLVAQKLLTGYRKRLAKIDRDAERIDNMVNGALDLKRTHASIQDARASLQDARSSLLLGWAVMGFTVITVLFAPIAFMTALFALPIDGLLKKQHSGTNAAGDSVTFYSSGYITWTFFIAEIGALIITALAIWGALKLRDWIKPASAEEETAKQAVRNAPPRPRSIRSAKSTGRLQNDSKAGIKQRSRKSQKLIEEEEV